MKQYIGEMVNTMSTRQTAMFTFASGILRAMCTFTGLCQHTHDRQDSSNIYTENINLINPVPHYNRVCACSHLQSVTCFIGASFAHLPNIRQVENGFWSVERVTLDIAANAPTLRQHYDNIDANVVSTSVPNVACGNVHL